jgi:hypothetical protein
LTGIKRKAIPSERSLLNSDGREEGGRQTDKMELGLGANWILSFIQFHGFQRCDLYETRRVVKSTLNSTKKAVICHYFSLICGELMSLITSICYVIFDLKHE